MNKNTLKRLIIIAVLLIALYIYVFDPFIEQVRRYPTGLSDFREKTGNYKIDPATILTSLGNEEAVVFFPEVVTPEAPEIKSPISWQQSDHLEVANELHKFLWKEPMGEWNLYYMNFNTTCSDNPSGFGLGDFYLFKTKFTYGTLGYTTRELLISPQFGNVTWGDGANFPYPLLGWKSIKLDKIKITAEEALRIAEENGGRKARLAVNNECTIQVRLTGDNARWEVRMSESSTATVLLRTMVDLSTGEIWK